MSSPEVVQAGERRLARIESLRALAALAVLAGHVYGLHYGFRIPDSFPGRVVYGGGYGVYLFFALTGYLLFWPFVQRSADLAGYARNRALRILPLYVVAVVVLTACEGGNPDWWRVLLMLQNFDATAIARSIDGVLWSVVVEVHFYLLLPVLAAVVLRGSAARAAALLLALGVVSLVVHEVKAPDSPLWRYNLPATFVFFVPGMLLALLRREFEQRGTSLGRSDVWLGAGAVLWVVVAGRFDADPLAAVAAFATVGACVLPLRESRARQLLDARWLAAIGVVSYSLYVWHLPLSTYLWRHDLLLLAVPASLAVAFASYRLVEAPFLRLRRRWSRASAPMSA